MRALEDELVAEKPWMMIGEASSRFRPQNSLLQATVEYDMAAKIAPEVTVETTQTLEDIIRQRIRDDAWYDGLA